MLTKDQIWKVAVFKHRHGDYHCIDKDPEYRRRNVRSYIQETEDHTGFRIYFDPKTGRAKMKYLRN